MEEIVKLIDENMRYEKHEIKNEILYIYVKSSREEVNCPNCGYASNNVHSRYSRHFRELPVQDMKVEIILSNRILFCKNKECSRTKFAETFGCLPYKAKRSKRLTAKIMEISLEMSSITASEILRNGIADVSKSTICNLYKKRNASN